MQKEQESPKQGCSMQKETTVKRPRNAIFSEENPPKKSRIEMHQTKLTDLSDDCLFDILKHLDVVDLTNVLKSSRRFLNIARDVFNRKYSNKVIEISNAVTSKAGPILNLQESVAALGQFGDLITKLNVSFVDKNLHADRQLENAIYNCCCKSLVDIRIYLGNRQNRDRFAFDGFVFRERFEKMERFYIQSSCSYEFSQRKIHFFDQLFPNTRIKGFSYNCRRHSGLSIARG